MVNLEIFIKGKSKQSGSAPGEPDVGETLCTAIREDEVLTFSLGKHEHRFLLEGLMINSVIAHTRTKRTFASKPDIGQSDSSTRGPSLHPRRYTGIRGRRSYSKEQNQFLYKLLFPPPNFR